MTCRTGKVCYDSRDKALAQIRYIERIRHKSRKLLGRKKINWSLPERCYLCEFCGNWHLTSKDYNPRTDSELKHGHDFMKYLDK